MAATEKQSKRYSKPSPGRGGRRAGAGRPAGVPNRVTQEFRQTVTALLDDNRDNFSAWVKAVAEGAPAVLDAEGKVIHPARHPNPAEATRLGALLAEFASPKLSRAEVTGEGGGALNVVIHKLG